MTPLLSFANVEKRYPDGNREITVLDGVSFEIEPGVFAGLYGPRRSGKSTLLRLAAGIDRPDAGTVRFDGRALSDMTMTERERLLGREVALMASSDWRPNPGESVVDHVVTSLGSEGLTVREARRRAFEALERVGVPATSAEEQAGSLSLTERTLVMLARALVCGPRLLLVDEPAVMPALGDRDRFYTLLRALASARDIALLVASEEMGALLGAGVMMSISGGEVRTLQEPGKIVRLPKRSAASAERRRR